jgi:RES domain-containing protein
LVAWRWERPKYFDSRAQAEGAFRAGGRRSFDALDTVPHTLVEIEIIDPAQVHVLDAAAIPNPHWLRPGAAGAGQQAFGDALLVAHPMLVLPSVVSSHCWNLVFGAEGAAGRFELRRSEPFALDPRLNPVRVAQRRSPSNSADHRPASTMSASTATAPFAVAISGLTSNATSRSGIACA